MKHIKHVKRRKFNPVKLVRLVVIAMVLVSTMSFAVKTTASGSTGNDLSVIVVHPGDTLWDIAKSNSDGENLQKVIRRIMDINDMKRSDIYPGQKLKIPLSF